MGRRELVMWPVHTTGVSWERGPHYLLEGLRNLCERLRPLPILRAILNSQRAKWSGKKPLAGSHWGG